MDEGPCLQDSRNGAPVMVPLAGTIATSKPCLSLKNERFIVCHIVGNCLYEALSVLFLVLERQDLDDYLYITVD